MITQKPWFGPRRFGYGWTPMTPEGWLATGAGVTGITAALAALPIPWNATVATAIAFVLCGVCWLTSGPPGHKAAPIRGRTAQERKRIYRDVYPEDPSLGAAVGRFDGPRPLEPEGPPPDLR